MKYIQTYESLKDANRYKKEIEKKGIDFSVVIRLDPSSNYKYLSMICKYVLDGVDFNDIRRYIKAFDILTKKNKLENKDIFAYKNFDNLKNVIDVVDIKSKGDIIGKIRQERTVILDNDDYLVFIPLSHRASVKYGMGAKWCISMKDDQFMWYALTNANILFYFVIVKNKEISNNLFNKFKNNLETSSIGAQGNINDPENFEKFVIMSFSGNKRLQIWTKSNHMLKNDNEFFKELGLPKNTFKNELPSKDINTIDGLD